MLSKSHCSIDRKLFEKIVNSNPALFQKLTWGKMLEGFFDELFPRPYRFFSLGATLSAIIFSILLGYQILSPFTESVGLVSEEITFNQTSVEASDEIVWEDNLNSIMVGRFWSE